MCQQNVFHIKARLIRLSCALQNDTMLLTTQSVLLQFATMRAENKGCQQRRLAINLRLPADLDEQVSSWAASNGLKRSQAYRLAFREGLTALRKHKNIGRLLAAVA